VCCSVLQCVTVCCSVLQCVAVCCSALQCVAECCSVWHIRVSNERVMSHIWLSHVTQSKLTHSLMSDMTHSSICDVTHSSICDVTHSLMCDVTHSHTYTHKRWGFTEGRMGWYNVLQHTATYILQHTAIKPYHRKKESPGSFIHVWRD